MSIYSFKAKTGATAKTYPSSWNEAAVAALSVRLPAASRLAERGAEMGLGVGDKMKQKIYLDEHGIETWDADKYGRVYVHIVNSMMCSVSELVGQKGGIE